MNISRLLLVIVATAVWHATAAPIAVYPTREQSFTRSLNGDWAFKYIPALDAGAEVEFFKPDFNASAWRSIRVPSNWELQGFAEPHYDMELQDGLGLYRRAFRIPESWRGRRVCLRFEGVAYGFEVWVNATRVGESLASAYNPHAFDITDALATDPNAENVLAVKVTTKPLGYEFDVNDDWALSGIYRDVTLFSVPTIHVQDVVTRTELTSDGAAELFVSLQVSQSGGAVRGRLVAPKGEAVSEFNLLDQTNGLHSATVRVTAPQLWTAETPALYRLQLTVSARGEPLQSIEERIGLREITIKDSVLLLNGRPIKLRGANRHDLEPETGRAVTDEGMRRDLEVMRQANMNFVRTSHYPPDRRFLQLCDELGFYVMDEVAIGKGEKLQDNPAYRETIMARTEATITRDKNHASVIIWSIGNENPVTDQCLDAGRLAKQLDPTRPICYPMSPLQFDNDKQWEKLPEFVDIYAPHYLTNQRLREFAEILNRPVILTEYAHALGLATDRIQDQWEIIQATPHFAGGAIWHLMDQGILRTSAQPVDRSKPTKSVWLDAHRYYDNHDSFGQDGIVYADRTPQTDFWETRKVYSPVQIPEQSVRVKAGSQEVVLSVENDFDFRSLDGIKINWSLFRNRELLEHGEVSLSAAARQKQVIRIPVTIPANAAMDVLALELNCLNEAGQSLLDRTIRLDLQSADRSQWLLNLSDSGVPKVFDTTNTVKIEHEKWTLTIERFSGKLKLTDREGHELISGLYPHAGRRLTLSEHFNARQNKMWRVITLTEIKNPEISVTQHDSGVKLAVSGRYPRTDKSDQSFVGGYQADIGSNGAITISYEYKPVNATGPLSEAGVSLVVPAELTEFRWIGQGPHAGYPGKNRLNEFGLFHLNRADLRFQGNRRETELALLTTRAGAGVALATRPGDVAVEIQGETTLLKHNAVISGLGNKIGDAETKVDSASVERIAGSFTLVPLSPTWPATLPRWFGKPSGATEVSRPFSHSYDQ